MIIYAAVDMEEGGTDGRGAKGHRIWCQRNEKPE